jgi:DNA-binding beta-propeller fold protein YncE
MKKRVFVVIFGVVLALFGCSPEKESISWYKTGELNFPDDRWEPAGIAIGPGDSVVVADMSPLCQVHLFDENGVLIGSLGEIGKEPGQFFLPVDVWVDETGNIFVAETETVRISVFNNAGELANTIVPEGIKVPFAVAAEDPDTIYLVDIEANDLIVVNNEGEILERWGEGLDLKGPEDVAVADGLLAVVDTASGKTLLCDLDGELRTELIVKNDPLFVPHEVAFGPKGDVYVLGLRVEEGPEGVLEGYIARFDDKGDFLERIEINSQKPTSIAVNSEGDLLVGDGTMHVVEIYTKE